MPGSRSWSARRRSRRLVPLVVALTVVRTVAWSSADGYGLGRERAPADGGGVGCGRSTARSCDRSSHRRRVYAAGHRGVDLAAAPGTPVRAANDGVVSFAGTVAGTLHVTDHARREPPHVVLVPVAVAVRAGQVGGAGRHRR